MAAVTCTCMPDILSLDPFVKPRIRQFAIIPGVTVQMDMPWMASVEKKGISDNPTTIRLHSKELQKDYHVDMCCMGGKKTVLLEEVWKCFFVFTNENSFTANP